MHAVRLRPAVRICKGLHAGLNMCRLSSVLRLCSAPAMIIQLAVTSSAASMWTQIESRVESTAWESRSHLSDLPPAAENLLSFSLHICAAQGGRPGGWQYSTAERHCRMNVFTQLRWEQMLQMPFQLMAQVSCYSCLHIAFHLGFVWRPELFFIGC